jgi:NADH dehydrogenase [ubiquinone] 1 alpha subcomplex assembly factor 7
LRVDSGAWRTGTGHTYAGSMSEKGKTKRPPARPTRTRPPARDPRLDSAPPATDDGPIPPSASPRVAALEAEVARLKAERSADADDLAQMLVRIAEAERKRRAAEDRSTELAARARSLEATLEENEAKSPPAGSTGGGGYAADLVADNETRLAALRRELDETRDELRRASDEAELAMRRAVLAERSAADGANALERARAELEADRSRLVDAEAKLARARREQADAREAVQRDNEAAVETMRRTHAEELAALRGEREEDLAALRIEHEEDERRSARAIEDERSATARARQQAVATEASLSEARAAIARAAELVEQTGRREEMAGALRARSFEQMRRVLAGEDAGQPPDTATARPLMPRRPPPRGESGDADAVTLDDAEIDLAE